MEESSPGAHIDYKVNSVIQEIHTRLPGIPETDTPTEEQIADIGLQGEGTPVVYYPCFQTGLSAYEEPKKRPKPEPR